MGKRDSSSSSDTRPQCEECIRMKNKRDEKKHAFDPSLRKYCFKHSCPYERAPGIKCHLWKSKAEHQCFEHFAPQCYKDHCLETCAANAHYCPSHLCKKNNCEFEREERAPYCVEHLCARENCNGCRIKSSIYCLLDACIYQGCEHEARPGRGRNYCPDHKCTEGSCQAVRKHIEWEGALLMVAYCFEHECQTLECRAKKAPGKDHCNRHCCTKQNCPSYRQADLPGTFCLKHYNETSREQNKEEIAAQLRSKAQRDAAEAAERRRRAEIEVQQAADQQLKRDEEERRKKDEEKRERAAREAERRFRAEQQRKLQREEDEAIQKAIRESENEARRKLEESARVKVEREAERERQRQIERERERLREREREETRKRAADEDSRLRRQQEEKDRIVESARRAKRAEEARILRAQQEAETIHKLRREEEDLRRREREEDKLRTKREQDDRFRAEKDDIRLRPQRPYAPGPATYDDKGNYYTEPRQKGKARQTDKDGGVRLRAPTAAGPVPSSYERDRDEAYASASPVASPRGQKREHSPRDSDLDFGQENIYNADDDFIRLRPSNPFVEELSPRKQNPRVWDD